MWGSISTKFDPKRRSPAGRLGAAEPLVDQAVTSPPSARPLVSFITAPTIGADRLLVSRADLFGGLGVRLDRGVDDRFELAGVPRDPLQARAPRWRPGRPPRRPARRGPLPGARARSSSPGPSDEGRQRLGLAFDSGRESRPSCAAGRRVPRSPSWRSPSARSRCPPPPLEEGVELRVGGERRGGVQAAELRGSAPPRRRQLGQRLAGALSISSVGTIGTRSGSGK